MSGERVIAGRYRLADRLGDGGMGVVWQGYDERLRRKVAVKQVRVQGEEMVRRTMREGRIAARLHHPQLITVYDVVEDGGQPYLIMEYLPSRSLADLLAERGRLPHAEAAEIGAQAAAGLAAAHAAGVIHRDVKPANVLVGHDGTVKITDFGISRVVADLTGTLTGTFAGTPAYLAPEVAKGEDATYASDVYSLGATLYTAVEGRPPAGDEPNPMKLLYRVSTGEVAPPAHAGPLTGVLTSLLATDPAARPTMSDTSAALAAVWRQEEVPGVVAPTAVVAQPAPPPATQVAVPPPPPPRKNRRNAILLAVGLVVVALAAALVTFLVNGRGGSPDEQANQPPGTRTTTATTTPTTTTAPPTSRTTKPTTTTTTPTTTPSTTAPAGAANPVEAITGYYSLMPGNRDAAWPRLSPNYQARGRASYDRWWSKVAAVSVSDVVATGPNTVRATVLYNFTDGRRVLERHQYGLVNQGGQWLIDTSKVLSSNPA